MSKVPLPLFTFQSRDAETGRFRQEFLRIGSLARFLPLFTSADDAATYLRMSGLEFYTRQFDTYDQIRQYILDSNTRPLKSLSYYEIAFNPVWGDDDFVRRTKLTFLGMLPESV